VKLKIDQPLLLDEDQPSKKVFLPGEVVIGLFNGLNDQGEALVDYPDNPSNRLLTAISTVALNQNQSGRQVAMLFAEGNPEKPVIVGLIHSMLYEMIEDFELTSVDQENAASVSECQEGDRKQAEIQSRDDNQVYVDGKQICIEGTEEVTFKCGKASITLTKSGKILIRGTYLLNRSTGVNRIMGGSVQVN
jgi:hypothetical protein